jgi:hypothetical protein
VVVIVESAETTEILVRPVTVGAPSSTAIDEAARVTALLYAGSPGSGDVPQAGVYAVAAAGRRLPMPDRILERRGEGFVETASASAAIDAIRIPWRPGEACVDFELVADVQLPGTVQSILYDVVPSAADRALVSVSGGRFFEVTVDGGVRSLAAMEGLPPNAMYFDETRDEQWLVGHDGRVFRGHADRGFTAAPTWTSTAVDPRIWLDGSRDGAPVELFLVTRDGRFARFDGTTWTVLTHRQAFEAEGVIWHGPGRGIAVDLETDLAVHYEQGTLLDRPLPLGISSVKSGWYVRGLGAAIGTFDGGILRFDEPTGRWEPIDRGPTALRVLAIFPLEEDGFIFGGQNAVFVQHFPGYGFCVTPSLALHDFTVSAQVGEAIVGCETFGEADDLRCAVIRPVRAR